MNRRTVVYVRVLLVLGTLVVLLAFLGHVPETAPRETWLPSSYNPIGAGHQALYQTLREAAWPVARWEDPLSRLPAKEQGAVLLITRSADGRRLAFSPQENKLIASWVRRGNTLLLLGAVTNWDDTCDLLRLFGYQVPNPNPAAELRQLFPRFHRLEGQLTVPPIPARHDTSALILDRGTPALPLGWPRETRLLWGDGATPFLLEIPAGAGRVVVGSSEQWLNNRLLPQGANFAILLHLIAPVGRPPTHFYFEERHHGFSPALVLDRFLAQPGILFAGMLLLLGAFAYFASSLVRFGEIIPLTHDRGRSTLEFIDSVADLYQRADLRNELIRHLYAKTLSSLRHHFNLPETASHVVLSERLARLHRGQVSWKKLADRFEGEGYVAGLPPSGWLRVTRELIALKLALGKS